MEAGGTRTIVWASRTQRTIRAFPEGVRAVFGRALYKAQVDKRHEIAVAMRGSLRGVNELARDHAGDTYRLYFAAKCPGLVHVLYCHKKKSKRGIRLPSHERDLIERRLKEALLDCAERPGGPT